MSYESALRQVGEWMDERLPHLVTVLETPDGFAVQWRWGNDLRDSTLREFRHEELFAWHRTSAHRRAAQRRGAGEHVPPAPRRSSYRNTLRAIGYELDRVSARFLLIDELEDAMLVTYQYPNPKNPYVWHKHMALMALDEQRRLLKDASARRQPVQGLSSRLAPR